MWDKHKLFLKYKVFNAGVLILLLLLFINCAHRYPIYYSQTNDVTPALYHLYQVNKLAAQKQSQITTKSGAQFEGKELFVTLDSSVFISTENNIPIQISNSDIKQISFKNATKGAWSGFLTGAIVGGTGGIIFGELNEAEEDDAPGTIRRTIGGLFFGSIGGFIGLLSGALIQDNDIFYFTDKFKKNLVTPNFTKINICDSLSRNEINKKGSEHPVEITQKNLKKLKADNIIMSADTTFLYKKESQYLFNTNLICTGKVPNSEINRISFQENKPRGFGKGALIGAPSGAFWSLFRDEPSEPAERSLRGALIGLVIGGSLTMFVESIIPQQNVFQFFTTQDSTYIIYK